MQLKEFNLSREDIEKIFSRWHVRVTACPNTFAAANSITQLHTDEYAKRSTDFFIDLLKETT
jgi:hypothetical protein